MHFTDSVFFSPYLVATKGMQKATDLNFTELPVQDEDKASQAPVTAVASKSATTPAASASDDCCEVCLVAWFCEACAMHVSDMAAECTDNKKHYYRLTDTVHVIVCSKKLELGLHELN